MIGETIAAINRAVVSRLERNLARNPAGSADSVKHLTRPSAAVFTGITAGFASLRLVCEPFFREKLLLICCEGELLIAVSAYDCFVLIIQLTIPLFKLFIPYIMLSTH